MLRDTGLNVPLTYEFAYFTGRIFDTRTSLNIHVSLLLELLEKTNNNFLNNNIFILIINNIFSLFYFKTTRFSNNQQL